MVFMLEKRLILFPTWVNALHIYYFMLNSEGVLKAKEFG
jgi:hypothetical protein